MKKGFLKNTVIVAFAVFMCLFIIAGCGQNGDNGNNKIVYVDDERGFDDYQFTAASISGVDALGRIITNSGDRKENKDVGMFYFLWLGAHTGGHNRVFDNTYLLENAPDELWAASSSVSPAGAYHFWGEPLYGYYHSADPWVLSRHVELFLSAGIDYLLFDTTNAVIYQNVVAELLKVLAEYQSQGFDVPTISFFTNTKPVDTVKNIYNTFYKEDSANYYPNLWYSPEGKPLIITDLLYFDETNLEHKKYLDFFDARYTQWPSDRYQDEYKFPWMSWDYPQLNHNGVVSVSVAQHTVSKMSMREANWGRGYDRITGKNLPEQANNGINYQSQWDTVFRYIGQNGEGSVTNTFVTGWNEWIAIKFTNPDVHFVDCFDKDYSRDLEMMKGGYGDNFYMQTVLNSKKFRYGQKTYYNLPQKTIDIYGGQSEWQSVRAYKDVAGNAMARDYRGYVSSLHYTDDTNRNDITDTQVIHDSDYVYIRITTAEAITAYTPGDNGWMNIWLATQENSSFNYVINREYGKLSKIDAQGNYTAVTDIELYLDGNTLSVAVPINLLNLKEVPAFRIRVSDNVDASDRMNFYIQGDSAPRGELGYAYGTFV